ncbi:hypothetical protein VdG1_06519 [Verticillium dahliae VDG1]|nr:hypothetical protein VdG1_06519 [Verticillium dahliae VDG1]
MASDSMRIFATLAVDILTQRWTILAAIVVLALALRPSRGGPPRIPERVPFVSNAIAFMTDPAGFLDRVSLFLNLTSTSVATFFVGPMPITLVRGPAAVQPLFRNADVLSPDKFLLQIFEHVMGMTKNDIAIYRRDGSARGSTPRKGWEDFPAVQRVWHRQTQVVHSLLGQTTPTIGLMRWYGKFFDQGIEEAIPTIGRWESVRLIDFIKREMALAATRAVTGTEIVETNPDLVEKFWAFDSVALSLMYGTPAWWDPRPARIRDETNGLLKHHLRRALAKTELDGSKIVRPDGSCEDPDWEPVMGSRYHRAITAFGQSAGLSEQGLAANTLLVLFGLNSNSIPITIWAIFELVKDPELFAAARKEADSVIVKDNDGKKYIDILKLAKLPLLQAIYLECMRLHVLISITREVVQKTTICGYELPRGRMVQAPTSLAGLDEGVWARDGHPATEFWPGRHIRTNDQGHEEFVFTAKSSEFFPYGGGVSMCAGRHFAKQEIMFTIALLVSRFDVEFTEWTHLDGSPSDREALGDPSYVGAASVPPDRDMKPREYWLESPANRRVRIANTRPELNNFCSEFSSLVVLIVLVVIFVIFICLIHGLPLQPISKRRSKGIRHT